MITITITNTKNNNSNINNNTNHHKNNEMMIIKTIIMMIKIKTTMTMTMIMLKHRYIKKRSSLPLSPSLSFSISLSISHPSRVPLCLMSHNGIIGHSVIFLCLKEAISADSCALWFYKNVWLLSKKKNAEKTCGEFACLPVYWILQPSLKLYFWCMEILLSWFSSSQILP